MRTEEELEKAISMYSDMVKRICFVYLKNYEDTEDVFQEVFLKYVLFPDPFQSESHEKAWLIRVTINQCKDMLKNFFRKKVVYLEEVKEYVKEEVQEDSEVLEAVLSLPKKYKIVVYLYYYEGYSAVEIAKLLRKNENTIYSNLSRGRAELKKLLGGAFIE